LRYAIRRTVVDRQPVYDSDTSPAFREVGPIYIKPVLQFVYRHCCQ
jgi:hypothetical protein